MSHIEPSPEFEDQVRRAVRAPDPDPAFVQRVRAQIVSRSVRHTARPVFRLSWALALVLALAILVITMPSAVAAIGRVFGYVRDIGLVENTGNLRMLAEPVSVQRDGVTLTITQALVYSDRIELIYKVDGISPENDGATAEDAIQNPTAFCGGVNIGDAPIKDGNALLRLPDGTLLERDYTGLYPENAYAMTPVYKVALPQDVTGMTLVLDCIPWARRGAVPENWEVPFRLVSVPAGTLVGEPVYQVPSPTAEPAATGAPSLEPAPPPIPGSALPAPLDVKLILEKVAPLSSGTVFYFSLHVDQPDPSLQSLKPARMYVIDSQGQQIPLTSGPFYPVEHPVGSPLEYFSTVRPADGPLTLVMENVVAYYAPGYVEPPQATPEEMSFSFDAGSDPQHGQSWDLDKHIEIAGYKLGVSSARAVTFEDVRPPSFIDGSQGYDYGYQFAVQVDPAVKASLYMGIISDKCWLPIGPVDPPESSTFLYTELCREGYPRGLVTVTISEFSVLVENTWQVTWTP